MRSEQCLVRGDHRGARVQGGKHEVFGQGDSTHQLHHDVRLGNEREGVRGEEVARNARVSLRLQGAHSNAHELELLANARREFGRALKE